MPTLIESSEITCPLYACQYYHDRKGCGELLKSKPGDCCVFCSYETMQCPPMQTGNGCCQV